MHNYDTLIGEHEAMDRLALRLSAMAAGPERADAALELRSELSLMLEDHLRAEDPGIYDRLMTPQASAAFRGSFALLADDWVDYLRGWDIEAITIDWDVFAQETVTMMGRLRARIADENRVLHLLALGAAA